VLALGHILAVLGGAAVDEMHAKSLLEQALTIAQEADGSHEECWIRALLANIAINHQEYDEAEQHQLTFLRIAQEIDHRRGQAIILGDLGRLAYLRGQYARAKAFHEQGLAIFRELGGQQRWLMERLNQLGEIALASRDLELAKACYQEALSLSEELADLMSVAQALCGLAEVALASGDVLGAKSRYRRALQVALEAPRVDTGRQTLVSLAKLYAYKGERELAVELVALVLNVCPDLWVDYSLRETEAFLSELRSGLSPDVHAAAQERGRARDLEATLKELLAELSE
jgi:tetratricopeptide (TPR) repeat protein